MPDEADPQAEQRYQAQVESAYQHATHETLLPNDDVLDVIAQHFADKKTPQQCVSALTALEGKSK